MRITYRGYQKHLIGSLASKYNKSPTELLLLLAKVLETNNHTIHEALDAQEKINERSKKRVLYETYTSK